MATRKVNRDSPEGLKKRLSTLLKAPENLICADCPTKQPRWASSKLGVFICIDCSGIHRNLGTHISFVRSVNLDSWTVEQVEMMEAWGNARGKAYFESDVPRNYQRPSEGAGVREVQRWVRDKYEMKRFVPKDGSVPAKNQAVVQGKAGVSAPVLVKSVPAAVPAPVPPSSSAAAPPAHAPAPPAPPAPPPAPPAPLAPAVDLLDFSDPTPPPIQVGVSPAAPGPAAQPAVGFQQSNQPVDPFSNTSAQQPAWNQPAPAQPGMPPAQAIMPPNQWQQFPPQQGQPQFAQQQPPQPSHEAATNNIMSMFNQQAGMQAGMQRPQMMPQHQMMGGMTLQVSTLLAICSK